MPSPSLSSFSSLPETNTSDSDTSENGGTSLLHQALKRKRTDSETEQLFKRQFFLTTASPNQYFNSSQSSPNKTIFKATSPVLSSSPKFVSRPMQSPSLLTTSTATTRPVFHIIQAGPSNRNLKLSTLRNSHVELCQLLQQNKNQPSTSTAANDNLLSTIKEELKN